MSKLSRCIAICAVMLVGIVAMIAGAEESKAALTPAFCQTDKEAGFANGGADFCAPTSISDGIIYLARSQGYGSLVEGTTKTAQISLIRQLAVLMHTDPQNGTDPDRILTGMQAYARLRGYTFSRLEVATWRPISAANKSHRVGDKPQLGWMRQAAADPHCAMVFNVGWYRSENDGYSRHSGHWFAVVGNGAGPRDFVVHNSLLAPADQSAHSAVTLTELTDDFQVVNSGSANGSMAGYFSVEGPGCPHGKTSTPGLDSVIVFSVKK